RKTEGGIAQTDRAGVGQIEGAHGKKKIEAPERDQQTSRTAQNREDRGLGEQLTDHPSAASAESGTNRDLALPRGAARQREIGHIRTGDQEHERDRTGQYQQG